MAIRFDPRTGRFVDDDQWRARMGEQQAAYAYNPWRTSMDAASNAYQTSLDAVGGAPLGESPGVGYAPMSPTGEPLTPPSPYATPAPYGDDEYRKRTASKYSTVSSLLGPR